MSRRLGGVAVLLLLALEGIAVFPSVASGQSSSASPVIRLSVFTDRYVYSPTDTVTITMHVTNLLPSTLSGLTVNSSIWDSRNSERVSLPPIVGVSVGPLTSADINQTASITLPDANYQIVSNVNANGTRIGLASVPLVVLNTAGRKPLTLAFVWHMHQPIYLNLKGQFEQPWVQVHSGSDFVYNGTWYGAYPWQVMMLQRHPGTGVTINLQPSLLYQWNATMHSFSYNGTYPGGGDELHRDLAAVNATVAGYRSVASSGQAEILTSPFYHPLSAILVKLGLSSDLLAQIELGRNYTRAFMGVNPEGMWTPEMGFTMKMVPIIQQAGIKYTVLDGQNHFTGASGPSASASMHQPFELDGANGSHIVVFFRDTTISNELTSNWMNIPDPRAAASNFIAAVAGVYRNDSGGVLTIASDGENPIVVSGVVGAIDLDTIYGAIQSQKWLQTSTLGSIIANRPVTAHITLVPDGSWSGGFGIWIGIQQKTAIWQAVLKARSTLVNLTVQHGANNPEIKKLWNYLYVAEGSDWEFQTPGGPAWFAMQGYRYASAATLYQVPVAPTVQSNPYPIEYLAVGAGVIILAAVGVVLLRRRRA